MIERILTDNPSEKLTAKWDGTKFALVHIIKELTGTKTIVLNHKEMFDLIEFAGKLGGE